MGVATKSSLRNTTRGDAQLMRLLRSWIARRVIIAASLITAGACVFVSVSKDVKVQALDARNPYDVKSPVKAHLRDGSTVIYDDGIQVSQSTILPHAHARRVGPLNETMPLGP